ncbi:hypothetical protein [Primorskyibacter sp. S87]|uniref:hypothetical protein n=1 Tax=Primorskyibacter sp. S87 TaxID=3415126 RepID=UPI003C7A4F65
MGQTGRYHGGLVYLGNRDSVLDHFSRIASATLEDYGHPVERQTALSADEARIICSQYMIKLELEDLPGQPTTNERAGRMDRAAGLNPHHSPRHRLAISICPVAEGAEDREITELLLVVMLYRMVDMVSTESIEWLDPNTVLTLEQFLGAFANVSPRRVRGRQQVLDGADDRFAPVDETAAGLAMHYEAVRGRAPHGHEQGLVSLSDEEILALAFREHHPDAVTPEEAAQSDIRRLATWGMTGMLAFLSAPAAIPMAAVNLVRGEDFRLNTQILSLTGLLVVTNASGALASIATILPL